LVEREPMPLAMGGFGREARDAMAARSEHLAGVAKDGGGIDWGFGRKRGLGI
jgi:hypothetical protein